MQTNPNPNRFSGLVAILGLSVLALGLVIMLLLPEIRLAGWILMALGGILVIASIVMDFRHVSKTVAGRQGRLRMGTTAMASIFLGITIVANAISIGNYQRFDVTRLGQFTLTEPTKQVMKQIAQPIVVMGFYEPGDPIGNYGSKLIAEYQRYTDLITYQTVDPVVHPDQAKLYGITQSPSFVFQTKGGVRVISPQDLVQLGQGQQGYSFEAEYPFTSAIMEVTGLAQKKVYFLTGDGEHDITSDYGDAKAGLLFDLYVVDTLNLTTTPVVPTDCAALIIAAPQTLSPDEIGIISAYLNAGGQTLILTDPNFPTALNQLVSPWGINLENGTAIDPSSNVAPHPDVPIVSQAQNAFNLPSVYFPGAIAITAQQTANANLGLRQLLITSNSSWLDRHFDPSAPQTFDASKDLKGPLNLGYLIAATPPDGSPQARTTRIAVIGNSTFANNDNFFNANNSDLFLNSVGWLASETQLITIRQVVIPFRQLVVNPAQINFMRYSTIAMLPLLVLLIGTVVWWRRR